MKPGSNPIRALLHDAMGIDSFALDGEDQLPTESWEDRPHMAHSPSGHLPRAIRASR